MSFINDGFTAFEYASVDFREIVFLTAEIKRTIPSRTIRVLKTDSAIRRRLFRPFSKRRTTCVYFWPSPIALFAFANSRAQ